MSEKDTQVMAVDEKIPDEDEKDGGKAKTFMTVLKVVGKTMKFLFSTAGLFVINCIYLVIGAKIFMSLEQYNEKQGCFIAAENYARAENASVYLMMNIATDVAMSRINMADGTDGPGYQIAKDEYTSILRAFSLSVLDAGHNASKDCSMLGEEGGPQYSWSFENSLVFAMTVTTTIGYGVIAPATDWGRATCMAYALVGIPLLLFCLVNVGEIMAQIFRYVYATVCCCGCCRIKQKKQKAVGDKSHQVCKLDENGKPIIESMEEEYDDDDDDDDEEEEEEESTVPLTISMIVLLTFTFFGAGLFGVWEDWNFIDATYFCFVTYSTIGFGDIVPGTTNLDSPESQSKLIVTGIYQVIGIAIISMCFELIQDELKAKFAWLGEKCCGKKKDPEEDTDEESAISANDLHPPVDNSKEKTKTH